MKTNHMGSKSFNVLLLVVFGVWGCASVDPKSVQPRAGAPEAAQISEVVIPYNENLPKFVLMVEAVTLVEKQSVISIASASEKSKSADETDSAPGRENSNLQIINYSLLTAGWQPRITAQLISALNGVANFTVVDKNIVQKNGGYPTSQGERGPFTVRAQITEYNEKVRESSSKLNLLTIYRSKEYIREGVVALEVSVTHPKSGEILASFPVRGTFTSRESRSGQGLILPIGEQREYAQSVFGQAMRVALNSASIRLVEELKSLP